MSQRILINGEATETVSALDRGLQFGDGLFETLPVIEGEPIQLKDHLQRLRQGCERLDISFHGISAMLEQEAHRLSAAFQKATLKIIVTRGNSQRGYAYSTGMTPTRILIINDWAGYPAAHADQGIRIKICLTPISENPALAGLKHLNRLDNVMARAELDDAHVEGLMADSSHHLIEGTMSNLFLVRDQVLITPPLEQAGVAGIMRQNILDLAQQRHIKTRLANIDKALLEEAQEVFLCNSLIGIWPVTQITNVGTYNKGPITQKLQQALYRRYPFLAGV